MGFSKQEYWSGVPLPSPEVPIVEFLLGLEAVYVCARILLKYTLNVDEENKAGGKLPVWFRSLLSLLGEPT